MEAVAPGDHDYMCHQPSSEKAHFSGPSDNYCHDADSKESVLHGSSSGFIDAEVDSFPADGNGCKAVTSTWSPSFPKSSDCEGNKFCSNGEGGANGYHSDGAHETLERGVSVTQAQSQTCMDHCETSVVAEMDEDLGGGDSHESGVDEGIDGVQDTKHVKSRVEKFVAPLNMPESTEILDFDVSQCYSADEWSSQASTDSSLLASASPAWPSPVFNRCMTAPIGASIIWDENEHAPTLLRSKTDKEKRQKLSEALYQMPSPVEKLSERKRKKIIENLVRIKNDGTVEVDVDRGNEIAPTLFELDVADHLGANIEKECKEPIMSMAPYLEIAMLIVGTRGDVQPFIAIGKRLRERGHRVRLATHANFRGFVTSNGLEFYPLGGDPKILAGYMVKNKGFLPSGPSEISIQKKQLKAIMNTLLPACTKADGDSGAAFKADAIIANPPAYGHVHVAEYLDVPLHIFFTMPWT